MSGSVGSSRWFRAALLVAVVAVAACPRPRTRTTTDGVTASDTDTFPRDFTPPPPLPPAPGADPAAYGAGYLDLLAARIEPGWTQFLEDCRLRLPPSHPLNSPTLEATLNLVIDVHGAVVTSELVAPSGDREFDDAAVGVTADAAPFPAPAREFLSDDDLVYVTWRFARDRRQAGAATAKLTRIEWGLERAVPRFLDDGNLTEAARRVARATDRATDPVAVGFGERIMAAVIREGLASPDAGVQRLAIAAAGAAKIRAAARELRAIADGAMDVGLRGEAITALAAVGDTDATALLTTILERDAGANLELTAATAGALVALGAGDRVAAQVKAWFDTGRAGAAPADRARTWAALIATSGGPVPTAIPELGRLVSASEPRVRAAACRGLGAAAPVDGAAWKALGRGLKDADAGVRAACAGAIASAAAAGGKSRATWWLVAPLLRDRDERVRAAVVAAMGRLDPRRARTDLAPIGRDKSPLVAAAAAEAAARGGDVEAAAARLGHDSATVRLAAAAALADHGGDAGRARLAGHVDTDLAVRLRVIGVLPAGDALIAATSDPDPAIAIAGRQRAIEVAGRGPSLSVTAAAIAEAAPASATRVQLAAAWLAAR